MNVSSLISQNAYVFILATGMLLCILTGGNIDLSVGSVVCFVGAIVTDVISDGSGESPDRESGRTGHSFYGRA